jgi:hypothetical protein
LQSEKKEKILFACSPAFLTTLNLAAGVMSFSGVTHPYAEESAAQANGTYPITVTVTDSYGRSVAANMGGQVNDAALGAISSAPLTGIEGQAVNTAVVATFPPKEDIVPRRGASGSAPF